jgi:hypothetical protein
MHAYINVERLCLCFLGFLFSLSLPLPSFSDRKGESQTETGKNLRKEIRKEGILNK